MKTQDFKSLLRLSFIDLKLSSYGKSKKLIATKDESYFCFKLIFKAQIEGQVKGFQTIEDRFILVRADNYNKAETKVRKEAKQYEEPYLNSDGYFVRWKLDSISDNFQTFIQSKKDFDSITGVEVFSSFRERRLRKEDIWNGD